MLRKFHWLFCHVILFMSADCLDVYINNQNGADQESCESSLSPCKTISYAYNKAMRNATLEQLNLLLQGNYELDESVNLNVPHDVLSSLKLSAADQPVQVIGAHNYTFLFGCDECEYRSLNYSFLVEDLIFVGFRGFAAVKARFVDVSFRKCQFIRNNCSAVYCIDAGVTVEECSFEWNYGSCDLSDVLGIGGAVRLVFRYHGNLTTTIKNSSFNNNSACLKEVMDLKLFGPLHHFRYYGGAVTAVYKNESNGNTLGIDGCNFNGNKALFGGALYLSVADKSSYNKFLISNSVFNENTAFTSGGAFAIKTFNRSSSNNITFKNAKFHRNLAVKSGGAGKILFQNLDRLPKPMYFLNVSFTENRATMDGALGIGSNLRNIRIKDRHSVYFENVEFLRNAFYLLDSSYYYTGALKSHGIDLRFTGTVLFAENSINSALYLCGAFVEVDGNVTFDRNIATSNGGGISLTDGSTLLLKSGSSMLFNMNFAWMNGGAIYYHTSMVDNEVYSYNPICFLQYEKLMIPASQWNVSMRFIQNGAGIKGAAIYASTIRQCVWTEEYPFINYKKAFRWSDRFYYHENYIGYSAKSRMRKIGQEIDIATDVYQFELGGSNNVTAQPGDNISLNITAIDEYQQKMNSLAVIINSAYYSISSTSNPEIKIEDPLIFVSTSKNSSFSFRIASKAAYHKIKNRNETQSKELNIIASNSVFGPRVNVKLHTQLCRLGYRFDTNQLKCVCDYDISELKWCRSDVLHIGMGYWANESQKTPNKLITFICPQRHCSCYQNSHEINCRFIASDPNRQCRQDREGKLCGKCIQGKSISLPSYSCKDCTDRAASIFTLIFVIVLVLALCVGIIYFNPSYSEYLKGVFFYTQILPYLFNGSDIAEQLALRFSTLINSVAVGSMPVEMCLFDGLDLIEAIGLSYAIPLSAALVLVTVYLLSKYRFLTFHRDSPFESFWILISVVYKFLAETSLLSLACFRVDDDLIFFFDGSQKCFVGKHLALFIPSVLILIFIVLPLPIIIVLTSYGYIRVSPHIRDVIAKGYRTKYRWWAAVDIGRRLLFAAIFIFTPYLELRKVLLIFASVLTCLSHATILPYENKYANKGETFLLAGLTLIAGLQAMQISDVQTTSSVIVVSATIIYTGLVIISLTYKKVYARYKRRKELKNPNSRPMNCPASPVDVTGRPYNVPKRVFLADKKKAKKTRDSEETLRQPLVQRGAEND